MTDIATGLFTLGGAAVGAVGTQISGIMRTNSKSRARKQRAAHQQRDEKSARWRSLYTDFIASIRAATLAVASARTSMQTPQTSAILKAASSDGRAALRARLSLLRDTATQVQIDGSKEALKIADNVINGIAELAQMFIEEGMIGSGELDRVYKVLIKAEADMITLSREDFGADAG